MKTRSKEEIIDDLPGELATTDIEQKIQAAKDAIYQVLSSFPAPHKPATQEQRLARSLASIAWDAMDNLITRA